MHNYKIFVYLPKQNKFKSMEEILKQTVTFYDLILIFICYIVARLIYAFIYGFIKGVKNSIKKIKNKNN